MLLIALGGGCASTQPETGTPAPSSRNSPGADDAAGAGDGAHTPGSSESAASKRAGRDYTQRQRPDQEPYELRLARAWYQRPRTPLREAALEPLNSEPLRGEPPPDASQATVADPGAAADAARRGMTVPPRPRGPDSDPNRGPLGIAQREPSARSLAGAPREGWEQLQRTKRRLRDFHVMAPFLQGVASWYGPAFHGKPTAGGEVYNQYGLTAAHPVLPLGTMIEVENLNNGNKVWVRVNDRGPYAKGRILDLSRTAAERLNMVTKGTAPVRIAVLRWPKGLRPEEGLKPYTQYVVQVAAYPTFAEAAANRKRMQARFPGADFRLDRGSGRFLAVVSGPYDTQSEAARLARRFRQSGVTNLVRRYRK